MLESSAVNEWGLMIQSAPLPSLGTVVNEGNNTYSPYSQIFSGAQVTEDIYAIDITAEWNCTSGAATAAIMKLGLDPAGGTNFVDTILDLLVGCAGSVRSSGNLGYNPGPISYHFPLFIKAGTSIGLTASRDGAIGAFYANCQLYGRPSHPHLVRTGRFVRTFGSVPAASRGTWLNCSVGSKSAYVQVGDALTEPLWYWGLGINVNNNAMVTHGLLWDLAIGDDTNKRIIIPDMEIATGSAENMGYRCRGAAGFAKPGDKLYIRGGTVGNLITGWNGCAYGVGG